MKIDTPLVVALSIFAASCSAERASRPSESGSTASGEERSANAASQPQILLTNSAKFKGNRALEGASGFLIKHNGGTYAVTARHLLGEAGGIKPEVRLNELARDLISCSKRKRPGSHSSRASRASVPRIRSSPWSCRS